MFLRMCFQQWVSNEVVTTERQQCGTLADDLCRMRFNRIRYLLRSAEIEEAIAIINDGEFVEWIESETARLGVPFLVYDRSIPEEEFLDYNHVTPAAATLLSDLLASDLRALGW